MAAIPPRGMEAGKKEEEWERGIWEMEEGRSSGRTLAVTQVSSYSTAAVILSLLVAPCSCQRGVGIIRLWMLENVG
jgi:hypothetical protein